MKATLRASSSSTGVTETSLAPGTPVRGVPVIDTCEGARALYERMSASESLDA